MSTAYEALASATNLSYDKEADLQEYLNSLIQAVNGLDEDAWTGLSEDAQKWFNDAVKEIEGAEEGATVTLNPPAGMISEEASDEKAPAEKKPKAKKEKQPKEAKPKKEKVIPAARHVREILCEDCSLTLAQVMEKLQERGIEMKPSSAQVVYLNTTSAFKVAAEVGEVKDGANVILTSAK